MLQRELTRLKELCRFPPLPDAICFEHVDHTESRSIYKDGPTFEVTLAGALEDLVLFHFFNFKLLFLSPKILF